VKGGMMPGINSFGIATNDSSLWWKTLFFLSIKNPALILFLFDKKCKPSLPPHLMYTGFGFGIFRRK
jgi:hypothetical protein